MRMSRPRPDRATTTAPKASRVTPSTVTAWAAEASAFIAWRDSVWVAAYGQVFFSLSLAFTVIITYASYLPRRSELSNSGFIMALANSGF